jgi:polysaccharide biosynthesis transport protein
MDRPSIDHFHVPPYAAGDGSSSGSAGGDGLALSPLRVNPPPSNSGDGSAFGDGSIAELRRPVDGTERSLPVLHQPMAPAAAASPPPPLFPEPPDSSETRWAFYDRLDMLRRGRAWIAGVAAVVVGIMALMTVLTPRQYDAYSLLLINARQPVLDAAAEYASLPGLEERKLLNQALFLQHSPEIAERTARRLLAQGEPLLVGGGNGVEMNPEALTRLLQSSVIRVELEGDDVDAVRITASAPSPDEAARIAVIYTEEYVARTRETSRMAITSARAFLEDQLAQRRLELAEVEGRIERFERSTGSIDLSHQAAAQITQVSHLEAALDRARVEHQLRGAALRSFENELAELHPRIEERMASGSEQELRQINESIATLEGTVQSIRQRNPDLARGQVTGTRLDELERQLTDLRRRRSDLTRQYVGEVVASGGIDITNQQRGGDYLTELRRRMAEERVGQAGAEAEIGALQHRLREAQSSLLSIPHRSIQLVQLRRQQTATETMVLYLSQRAEQARIAEETDFGLAQVLRPATPPTSAARPRVFLNLAVGLLLGLLCGVGVAAFRHRLDDKVHAPRDLQSQRLPVLGVVPPLDDIRGRAPGGDRFSSTNEIFRQLLANLCLEAGGPRPQALVVAGAERDAGASTTALHLAVAAARSGLRTLLVDGDLHRPTIDKSLKLEQKLGKALDKAPMAFWTTNVDQLIALTPTTGARLDGDLWNRQRVRDLLFRARPMFDLIIFDAPPVLLSADASVIASQTDAVLLVARSGSTHQDALAQAATELRGTGGELLGTVLNGFHTRVAHGYQHTFGYRHKQLAQLNA